MPLDQDPAKELRAKLKLARSGPLSFALVLGKKPETTAFLMDKKKTPDLLLKEARKQPDVDRAKSCGGTVSAEGSKLFLRCADDPPTGLVKKLKAFLKANRLEMKPVVLMADGQEFEAEPEDDTARPQAGPPEGTDRGTGGGAAEAGALERRLDGIADRAEGLPETAAAQVRAGLKGAFQAIGAGRLDEAALRLDRLEEALAEAKRETVARPPPDRRAGGDERAEAAWRAASARLAPRVQAAVAQESGDARKIATLWAHAGKKAAKGDFASALKAASVLAGLMRAAGESRGRGSGQDGPGRETEAWQKIAPAMETVVARASGARPEVAQTLGTAWGKAVTAAEAGRHAEALAIAGKMRRTLKALGARSRKARLQGAGARPSGAGDPAARKALAKEFAAIRPRIGALLGEAAPAERTALQKLLKAFAREAKSGAGERARASLETLEARMAEIANGRVARRQARAARLAAARERATALRARLDRLAAALESAG
ncbi:MAG TPA: hypothetical protein VJ994_06705 [Paracoccaceae bacterium]|nr:hypothetical protein [Paracoccaceae bacterium]